MWDRGKRMIRIKLGLKNLLVKIGLGSYLIEFCEYCGVTQPIVWWASDAIWMKLVGKENACVCPQCLDKLAAKQGIILRWEPGIHHSAEQENAHQIRS